MEHIVKAIQRIDFRRNTNLWANAGWIDKWQINIDGITTTVRLYSSGVPLENLDAYSPYCLAYENKAIRKHKDYQQIRCRTLDAIMARYRAQFRVGLNEIQND